MGALAADFTWTMEDDFRLRKAAETGTSLESLASGTVQFSKRFTIQELQDRWLALLYDPVVSAESSARMLEFEHSASAPVIKANHLGNIEENTHIPVSCKRKSESIRKRFYAMRKRMRDNPSNSPDLGFPNDTNRNEEHPPAGNLCGLLENEPAEFLNQNCIGDDSYIEPIDESDEFKEIYDLLDVEGPELPAIMNQGHFESLNEYPEIENQMCGESTTAVTNANSYLMEISNNLLDLTMEDDFPLMDADGNLIDKSYIDDFSSLLLDSPNKDAKHDTVVDGFLDNNTSQPECGHLEIKSFEGLLPPSKPLTSTIICTLNTEDPEIPSNDDVFLLNLVPSTAQDMQMDVYTPPPHPNFKSFKVSTADSKRDFKVPKQIIPKESKIAQSQLSSPMIGSQLRSEILRDHRIKQDLCRSNCFPVSQKEMHHCNSVSIVTENKTGGSDIFTNCVQLNAIAGNDDLHDMNTVQEKETLPSEVVSTEAINPILDARNFPINEEAETLSSPSDDDDDDGDDAIPNFNDVEAMILEEDSSLDEQYLYLNGIGSSEHLQTMKYENADTQKRIMRLQQGADAFMKRDMTSRGAFAILQGWHMKYYVKKPEVLIGRSTTELNVDIDLGREGQNNRVSRRQAIIHMDPEGFFHMKNLSKYSIFINSVEVATNQSISLTSSCLIEIKGMAFLFETNEACIKQYVDSIKNKTDMEDIS